MEGQFGLLFIIPLGLANLSPMHTHTHTPYAICVCVCVCVSLPIISLLGYSVDFSTKYVYVALPNRVYTQ